MDERESGHPSLPRRSFLGGCLGGIAWGATSCERTSTDEIHLDEGEHFQTMEGWGTSLIGWKRTFAELTRSPWFATYYLEKLGASALRVDLRPDAVGARRRIEEITWRSYQTEDTRGGNDLRTAEFLSGRAAGPFRVIASVWSPPPWMKHNQSGGNGHPKRENYALELDELQSTDLAVRRDGNEERRRYLYANSLRHDHRLHFAKSLLEWCRLYEARGVPLYGLSLQNEPRFSHWFGSCVYTAPEYAATLAAVERVFSEHKKATPRLFGPETMAHDERGNSVYFDALFADASRQKRLHALACHGYVDGYRQDADPESARRFRSLAQKHAATIWMTEGGTGGHDWPAPLHELGASLYNALTHGGASLVTPWQSISEEPDGHALGALSRPTKKLSVAAHFFRFVRPGAVRIAARSEACDVVAFVRERRLTLILLNRTAAPVQVRLPDDLSRLADAVRFTTSGTEELAARWQRTDRAWTVEGESIETLEINLSAIRQK